MLLSAYHGCALTHVRMCAHSMRTSAHVRGCTPHSDAGRPYEAALRVALLDCMAPRRGRALQMVLCAPYAVALVP